MTGSEVVAAARGTPEQQAEATSKFAKHFEELLTAGLTLAGASKVERERERKERACLRVHMVSTSLCTLALVFCNINCTCTNAHVYMIYSRSI